MRIVLRKAAHAQQAVQGAGAFIAVYGAQFGVAQRQIAVAAQVGFINLHMERAVHGLNLVFISVHFHGVEHAFGIKPRMTADFKQMQARNMRAVHHVITALDILVFNPVFQNFAQHAAFGVHQNQPRAHIVIHAEQVQLRPQFAVVALGGFFLLFDVGV